MDLNSIRNIIFDLGGVIINLDIQKSVDALQQLSRTGRTVPFSQKEQSELFDLLEIGAILPEEFRRRVREEYDIEADDDTIDAAWSAMLLDIPGGRIELLQRLSQTHRLFLLSNTNAIHYLRFNEIVRQNSNFPNLDGLFEKTYYSHLIGRRKPHPEVFEHIVTEQKLNKSETLFIDDTYQHIEGARLAGLNALYLQPPLTISEVFQHAD